MSKNVKSQLPELTLNESMQQNILKNTPGQADSIDAVFVSCNHADFGDHICYGTMESGGYPARLDVLSRHRSQEQEISPRPANRHCLLT